MFEKSMVLGLVFAVVTYVVASLTDSALLSAATAGIGAIVAYFFGWRLSGTQTATNKAED